MSQRLSKFKARKDLTSQGLNKSKLKIERLINEMESTKDFLLMPIIKKKKEIFKINSERIMLESYTKTRVKTTALSPAHLIKIQLFNLDKKIQIHLNKFILSPG